MKQHAIIFILGLFLASGARAEHLYISTGFTPPVSDYFQNVLEEVDRRLEDISISFEVLPAERSLALVNKGINDAECCRIAPVVTKKYTNLVEVPTSFFTTRFSSFTKDSSLKLEKFSDLKPYSVAVPKGWKLIVNKVTEADPRQLFVVTTPEQLFRMLDENRVEVGVVGYLSGLHVIKKLGLTGISPVEPPLVEKHLNLMLNKKHKNLVPIFDHVIKEMIRDGTIESIYKQYN